MGMLYESVTTHCDREIDTNWIEMHKKWIDYKIHFFILDFFLVAIWSNCAKDRVKSDNWPTLNELKYLSAWASDEVIIQPLLVTLPNRFLPENVSAKFSIKVVESAEALIYTPLRSKSQGWKIGISPLCSECKTTDTAPLFALREFEDVFRKFKEIFVKHFSDFKTTFRQ